MRAFQLLNVFTVPGDRFSGNPLCVFEDGRGLSDGEMQGLARQFNLSETTFLLPPSEAGADAQVRIFTPSTELPFAGHPTLGTAHVVRALKAAGDKITLQMKAGLVPAQFDGERWTLTAARAPQTRANEGTAAEHAAMLGLPEGAVVAQPRWIDTGVDQLIVPVADVASVRAAQPDPSLLARLSRDARGGSMAYVWARDGRTVVARAFFLENGGVVEDPATGSACANLGGFLLTAGERTPLAFEVRQGEQCGRPSLLGLSVDAGGAIRVSGRVTVVGRGTLD